MSKQFFTDKQVADLLLNPNVFSVTRSTLMLTKSFKEKFYAEYLKGTLPRNILERHGFSADIIGQRRIWSITQHIKDEYAKYGEFHEGAQAAGPLQRPGGRQRARFPAPSRNQGGIPAATGGVFKEITSVKISRK